VTLDDSGSGDLTFTGGEDVNLVWEEEGGDNSATLYTFDAPDSTEST